MSKKKKIKRVKKTCKKKRKQSCGREKVIGEPQMVKPLPEPYFPPLVFKSESLWRKFLRLIGYIP
jgi:hypothetical protein